MKVIRYSISIIFIILILGTLILNVYANSSPQYYVDYYADKDGTVMYSVTEFEREYIILSDNIEVVTPGYYTGSNITRERLITIILKNGFGKIIDLEKAEQFEIDAQNIAIESNAGLWENENNPSTLTSPSTSPTSPETNREAEKSEFINTIENIRSFLTSFWEKYKAELLSITMIGAIIGTVIRTYKKRKYHKKISAIFFGMPSSGKTALIYRMFHENVHKTDIRRLDHTKNSAKIGTESLVRGKYTLTPYIKDAPGDDIISVLDKDSSLSNRVFIFVIAPNEFIDEKIISEKYLNRQLERLNTIMLILFNSKKYTKKKPDKIILFFNKCDIVSEDTMRHAGQDLIEALAINSKGIKYSVLYGSAMEGHGIADLKTEIFNVVG
jgi:hypothetical protein